MNVMSQNCVLDFPLMKYKNIAQKYSEKNKHLPQVTCHLWPSWQQIFLLLQLLPELFFVLQLLNKYTNSVGFVMGFKHC